MAVYNLGRICCFTVFLQFLLKFGETHYPLLWKRPCFLFSHKEHIPTPLLFVLSSRGKSGAAKVLEMPAQQPWAGSIVIVIGACPGVFCVAVFPPVVSVIILLGCSCLLALGEDLELSTEKKLLGVC